jgi:hypothetical protein
MAKKEPSPSVNAIAKPTGTLAAYDFSGDAGAGMENVHSDDLSIPFLMMIQDLSPEYKKTHKDHLTKRIEGVEPGHIVNSLTREILNPNIDTDFVSFVPCSYLKAYVEWTPRDQGGGIVATHPNQSILSGTRKNDRGQDILPNGNLVVTTAYFFGFYVRNDEPVRVVLSMTSTQLKKARQWLSLATSIRFRRPDGSTYNPPLFSHVYNLSSVPESNDQGSWYGWKVQNAGPLSDELLIETGRSVVREQKDSQLRLANSAPKQEDETEI